MMKSLLPSHKETAYASVVWHESKRIPHVRYATRRTSLAQRIELTSKVRELTLKHEFLKAGDVADQLSASLADLLVHKLYLEWGLLEVQGLKIDGKTADTGLLISQGPEELAEEIVQAIREDAGLSEDERKNS